MAGGGSFSSDQRTAHLAADGQLVTGPCRVTSIQAAGAASSTVVLYDGTSASGTAHTFKFGTEGLEVYIPGDGIRFKTGVFLDLTATGGVTVTFN
jgi:hypothetical protein|tara:strand:+ start:543 stop:827 length:285 start_codon:yes stop_codon:yes gene_type:complete